MYLPTGFAAATGGAAAVDSDNVMAAKAAARLSISSEPSSVVSKVSVGAVTGCEDPASTGLGSAALSLNRD